MNHSDKMLSPNLKFLNKKENIELARMRDLDIELRKVYVTKCVNKKFQDGLNGTVAIIQDRDATARYKLKMKLINRKLKKLSKESE